MNTREIEDFIGSMQKYVNRSEAFLHNLRLKSLIKLDKYNSSLDGITLYEKPDIEAIEKLLKSDLLEVVKYEDFYHENEKHHIEAYHEELKDGTVEVKYNKHKGINYGRVYAKKSLGAINFRREIRGTIFSKNYKDIDIVNCHPNIYYQIAKVLKVKCPVLKRYVENRDQILEEVQKHYSVSRDTAKELFIRLLYLGGFQSWAKDHKIKKHELQFIKEIKYELFYIGNEIVKNNQELYKSIEIKQRNEKTYKNPYKVKATTISYYVQEIECRILEEIYQHCSNKKVIEHGFCSLCYDGIMIEKDHYHADLLIEFNKLILDKFGLDLKFEEKPMKSFLDILDDHVGKEAEQQTTDDYTIDIRDSNMFEYQILQLINPNRFHYVKDIINIGSIIKCYNFHNPLNIWMEFCSKVKQDNKQTNLRRWEKIYYRGYTIRTIHYFAKLDDKDTYLQLFQQHRMNDLFDDSEDNLVEINDRYLLHKKKLLKDNTKLCQIIEDFFEDDNIKTLSIRSPYDTGKTQLLKAIINDYNPTRILWLSYRKTLTYDIYSSFKHLDVKSYLDRDFTADRLIVQLESLLHLEGDHNIFNDIHEVPQFDLVVMDEIESLLNQFHSTKTFNGKNEDTFKFLEQIIKTSVETGKLIAMDGDLGARSYAFLRQFGSSINIKNTVMFNDKTLDIHTNVEAFEQEIIEGLKKGLKIFIPCMQNKYAIDLHDKIQKAVRNVKAKLYNATCNDKEKERDIKDIINSWSKADCVITTPTIEAGVSFDKEHFDRIYGVLSDGSCTQTAFFQMMGRVRKVKDPTIKILNYSKFKLNKAFPWTFDDVKEGLLFSSELREERQYFDVGGKILIRNSLTAYQINYIYNKVAEMNKASHLFLPLFKHIAEKKGFKVVIHDETNTSSTISGDEEIEPQQGTDLIYERILNARDLIKNPYQNEFQELLQKQKRSCLTEEEHYQILKHCIKLRSGLDILTIEIIKKFRYDDNLITNFACLFDLSNETTKDELMRTERLQKHTYILLILSRLGFQGIHDDKMILRDEFTSNMSSTIIHLFNTFKHNKNFNMLMNESRHKIQDMLEADFKAQFCYINTILKSYSIKIGFIRKKIKKCKNKIIYYHIQFRDNIDELLEYKINKGYKFKDRNNSFVKPSTISGYEFKYNELVFNQHQGEIIEVQQDTQQDITEPAHQQHVKTISLDIEDNISQEEEVVVKKKRSKKRSRFELFGDTPF